MQTNPKIIMEEDKPACTYEVIREQETGGRWESGKLNLDSEASEVVNSKQDTTNQRQLCKKVKQEMKD